MKSIQKIIWGLLVFCFITFMPKIAYATTDSESYVVYDEVKANGELLNGWSSYDGNIILDMNNETNYSFKIIGYNLESNENYILQLTSDFLDFSKKYTGEELMAGVYIERTDGNSKILSKVYLEKTGEELKNKYCFNSIITESTFDKLYFGFNNNFDSTELDAYFKKIAPDGKLELNSIKLNNPDFLETSISASLSKYNTDDIWVYGGCDENYENCKLYMSDLRYDDRYKEYDIEYIFQKTDNNVLNKVNAYLKKFERTSESVEKDLFVLDDLENINYKYMLIKNKKEDINTLNSIINYSSEIQALLEYGNLTGTIDTRAGWGDEFTAGGFGFLNLLYDGVIYGAVNEVGVKQVNTLYIDNSVADTTEAYISAALKRVQDYLPNANVKLTYAGKISDLDQSEWILKIDELIDVNKTLGEYYTLTIDGNSFSFFIVKDSSKMKNPKMNTVDLKTNIKINSDSYEVPLDSKINAKVIDKNSEEYKNILKKLNLDDAKVLDLKLYSGLTNAYITKLNNGKFKVYVPLSDEDLKRELNAYYIKDDGTIEIHEITIENGYGVFETDHFSTYTIGGEVVSNPNTLDSVNSWILVSLVSLITIAGLLMINKNKQNNK